MTRHRSLPSDLLEAAFDSLCAAPAAERARVAADLIATHPRHRDALLALVDRLAGIEHALDESFPDLEVDPATIGGMRVTARLGQGAFGIVYLCEQDAPVARRVAVKVLRPGAGDRETLRRFANERQVIATLSHPAITHFYDAGSLPDGRPFFVMEYVDGRAITTFCEEQGLACNERLRLFLELCRGVEHAHAHGVVHRDLKPGNVLVVAHTGRAQPKVIDFGIAKALAAAAPSVLSEFATANGRVLGTPGYMSPEQARGATERVDQRADVFSLGVMLFELLVGELPWPRGAIEVDPAPLLASRLLERRARTSPADEGTTLRRLAARVRGDLDWITRKAMQFDPADRYESVAALARDLERHLAGKPVTAGPPTWRYRVRKFTQRHRLGVLCGAFMVASCLGLGAFWWSQSHRLEEHFVAATTAAEQLLQRAVELGDGMGPANEQARKVLAQDALGFFEQWLGRRPDDARLRASRARALTTLSQVHWELGQGEAALAAAVAACEDAASPASDAGPVAESTAGAWRHRARALVLLGRWQEAIGWFARAIEAMDVLHGNEPQRHGIVLAATLREAATCHLQLGEPTPALAELQRSVDVLQRLVDAAPSLARAHADLVSSHLALALAHMDAGHLGDASSALEAAEAGLVHCASNPWRVTAMTHFERARLTALAKDLPAAIERYGVARRSCETWCEREPLQSRAHQLLVECLANLATVHDQLGARSASDATMDAAIAAAERRVALDGQSPGPRLRLRQLRYDGARALWDRFRRPDAVRALALLEPLVETASAERAQPQRWEVLSLSCHVRDSLGVGDVTAWRDLAAQLPAVEIGSGAEPRSSLVEAWLGVARAERSAGDVAAAARVLACLEPLLAAGDRLDSNYRSRVVWERAQLDLATGDFAHGEASLGTLLRMRPGWWSNTRAGAWRLQAARALSSRGDAEGAAAMREAALPLLEAAVARLAPSATAHAEDPWFVVPWGFAELGLAEIDAAAARPEQARARLERALPALERVRGEAHANEWDAARFAAGEELAVHVGAQRSR